MDGMTELHAISTQILSWVTPILLGLAGWAVKRIFDKLDDLKHCIVTSDRKNEESFSEVKEKIADHGARITRLETRCLLIHQEMPK